MVTLVTFIFAAGADEALAPEPDPDHLDGIPEHRRIDGRQVSRSR